jgi:hypothetical protein
LPVSVPPQFVPAGTHVSPAQHPSPAQVLFPQHGWPGIPQGLKAPATHTVAGFDPDAPGGTQSWLAGSKHAFFEHTVRPGQAGVPATPQYAQSFFEKQPWSVPHDEPTSTHVP